MYCNVSIILKCYTIHLYTQSNAHIHFLFSYVISDPLEVRRSWCIFFNPQKATQEEKDSCHLRNRHILCISGLFYPSGSGRTLSTKWFKALGVLRAFQCLLQEKMPVYSTVCSLTLHPCNWKLPKGDITAVFKYERFLVGRQELSVIMPSPSDGARSKLFCLD